MTAWLVTGGAGFIGTNFVRMLCDVSDIPVIVIDALTYAGNYGNLAELVDDGAVSFVKGDICDAATVSRVFSEHSIRNVVHFAAESHVDRSISGPGEFLRVNISGTYTLLEAARKAWANSDSEHRFVHVSTDEVYGTLAADDAPFTEDSQYQPNSPYSASKAASDHLVRAWHHTYQLPTITTNCSNNYGPWQFPEKLIPLMVLNALEGRELPVYGDGLQIRDWIHVEDHCRGVLAAARYGQPGETYAFGGSDERTNLSLVKEVCATVDRLTGHLNAPSSERIVHVKDRPGHDRRYAIDATKSQRELGWAPSTTVTDSLADVVRWYIDHRDWADRIRTGEYTQYYERQYALR